MKNLINILKDELILNKAIYLKLFFMNATLLTIFILIYELSLKEFLELTLDSTVIGFIMGQSIVMMMGFRNQKLLSLYSKLPLTLSDIYSIRFVKVFFISIIWIILFLPFRIAGFHIGDLPIMLVITLVSFGALIFMDMKVFSQRYGLIKRIIYIISPIIALVAVNVLVIFFLKKVHGQMTYDLFGIISIFVLLAISITLSFQVFILRKSYKY